MDAKELSTEVLVKKTVSFLLKKNISLEDLSKSSLSKDGVWYSLASEFSKIDLNNVANRLQKRWQRDTQSFKTLVFDSYSKITDLKFSNKNASSQIRGAERKNIYSNILKKGIQNTRNDLIFDQKSKYLTDFYIY